MPAPCLTHSCGQGQSGRRFLYVTDEKTEMCASEVSCPRHTACKWQSWDSNLGLWSQSSALPHGLGWAGSGQLERAGWGVGISSPMYELYGLG